MPNEELQDYNKKFIKHLVPNYNMYPTGYRIILNEIKSEKPSKEEKVVLNFEVKKSVYETIKSFLKTLGIKI